MSIHIYGFLDFLSLCSSIVCIVQSVIEDEVAKATLNYINLEGADYIGLQQIIATTSQSIKTKIWSTLVKFWPSLIPKMAQSFLMKSKNTMTKMETMCR